MEVGKDVVTEVLGGNKKVFIIPLYQRNYSWMKKECLKLFTDILSMTKYEHIPEYFIGTIVYMQHKARMNYTELTLIDGQQRLTTISLLLKAISKKMIDNGIEDTNEIDDSFLKNKRAAQDEYGYVLKLKPNSKDSQTYSEIMEDNEVTDKTSNMYINYNLFLDWLDNRNESKTLQEIFSCIENVKLVYIILGQEDDPQLVFETINSTGRDLMFSDLIRNCILTKEKAEKQNQLYIDYWKPMEEILQNKIEKFIRAYLQIKVNKVFLKSETYNTFRNFYEPFRENSNDILKEMLDYARFFSQIEDGFDDNYELCEVFAIFKYLDYTLTYPFIMRLLYEYYNGNVKKNDLIKIVNALSSFVFRKTVVQTNLTQQFATLMVKMYTKIKNSNEKYKVFLINLFEQDGNKLRFVTDEEFKKLLMERDIYNSSFADYLLKSIENSRSREKTNYFNISKDHIMPQNPNAEWMERITDKESFNINVHRLGNLTLTAYNSEKSNKVKDIYTTSKITLNKGIDIGTWNFYDIEERSDELSTECLNIWKYPIDDFLHMKKSSDLIYIPLSSMDFQEILENDLQPTHIKVKNDIFAVLNWDELTDTLTSYLKENYVNKIDVINQYATLTNEKDNGLNSGINKLQKIAELVYIVDEDLQTEISLN